MDASDQSDWVKIFLVFLLLGVLPVWVFPIVPMSLKWKLTFTLGALIGSYISIVHGTMGGKKR